MTCSALAGAAGGSAVTAAQEFVNVEINEFDRVLRGLGLQRETSYFTFREHFIALHDGGAHAAFAARSVGKAAKSLRSGCGMRGGQLRCGQHEKEFRRVYRSLASIQSGKMLKEKNQ